MIGDQLRSIVLIAGVDQRLDQIPVGRNASFQLASDEREVLSREVGKTGAGGRLQRSRGCPAGDGAKKLIGGCQNGSSHYPVHLKAAITLSRKDWRSF